MAIKEFKPVKPKFKIKTKYIVTFVLFIIVSIFCVGYRINANAQVSEYEARIAEIEQQIETLSKENEENLGYLNSSDKRAYYEKIAREYHDYAKPGEYVFYRTAS